MQNSFCAREEKEHEGEDFYVSFVPVPSVETVLRVAPTVAFFGMIPAVPIYRIITGNGEWRLASRFALSLQNLGAPVVNAK